MTVICEETYPFINLELIKILYRVWQGLYCNKIVLQTPARSRISGWVHCQVSNAFPLGTIQNTEQRHICIWFDSLYIISFFRTVALSMTSPLFLCKAYILDRVFYCSLLLNFVYTLREPSFLLKLYLGRWFKKGCCFPVCSIDRWIE